MTSTGYTKYKTDKIKEKQQVGLNFRQNQRKQKQAGLKFLSFQQLPSSGAYFLQLNMGENTVHMILKIPGD